MDERIMHASGIRIMTEEILLNYAQNTFIHTKINLVLIGNADSDNNYPIILSETFYFLLN